MKSDIVIFFCLAIKKSTSHTEVERLWFQLKTMYKPTFLHKNTKGLSDFYYDSYVISQILKKVIFIQVTRDDTISPIGSDQMDGRRRPNISQFIEN